MLRRQLCLPDLLCRWRLLRREGLLHPRQSRQQRQLLCEGRRPGVLQREVRLSRELKS
jgi:hypothetical protein